MSNAHNYRVQHNTNLTPLTRLSMFYPVFLLIGIAKNKKKTIYEYAKIQIIQIFVDRSMIRFPLREYYLYFISSKSNLVSCFLVQYDFFSINHPLTKFLISHRLIPVIFGDKRIFTNERKIFFYISRVIRAEVLH